MEQFAIVSPLGGIKEDMPSILLPDTYTPGYPTKNVIYKKGCICKEKGRVQQFTTLPDGRFVNMLFNFETSAGSRYFIAGSKDKIYRWNSADWTDITGAIEFTGNDTDYWSFTQYGDYLLFTNGIDAIHKWNGSGDIAALGGSPPKARFITSFKSYPIALCLTESGKHKMAWPAIGEMENWTGGDSGETVIIDTAEVTGHAQTTDYLIIFKKAGIYLCNFVGGDIPFNLSKRVEGIGTDSPDSITVLNNRVRFFSTNKRFCMFDGIEADDISEEIQETLDNVKEENFGLVQGAVLDNKHIGWLVPEGETDECNRLLILDVDTGAWYKDEVEGTIIAVGGYKIEANETWETMLAKPEITWDTVDPDWKWSDVSYSIGERLNIIGGIDGKIYQLFAASTDKGSDFTGIFATTKLDFKNPNIVKRTLQMQHYFKNEGIDREITLSARAGNNKNFEQAETFNLNGGDEDEFVILDQYVDFVGKTLQLQMESAANFQYIGTIFYYENLGLR